MWVTDKHAGKTPPKIKNKTNNHQPKTETKTKLRRARKTARESKPTAVLTGLKAEMVREQPTPALRGSLSSLFISALTLGIYIKISLITSALLHTG